MHSLILASAIPGLVITGIASLLVGMNIAHWFWNSHRRVNQLLENECEELEKLLEKTKQELTELQSQDSAANAEAASLREQVQVAEEALQDAQQDRQRQQQNLEEAEQAALEAEQRLEEASHRILTMERKLAERPAMVDQPPNKGDSDGREQYVELQVALQQSEDELAAVLNEVQRLGQRSQEADEAVRQAAQLQAELAAAVEARQLAVQQQLEISAEKDQLQADLAAALAQAEQQQRASEDLRRLQDEAEQENERRRAEFDQQRGQWESWRETLLNDLRGVRRTASRRRRTLRNAERRFHVHGTRGRRVAPPTSHVARTVACGDRRHASRPEAARAAVAADAAPDQ